MFLVTWRRRSLNREAWSGLLDYATASLLTNMLNASCDASDVRMEVATKTQAARLAAVPAVVSSQLLALVKQSAAIAVMPLEPQIVVQTFLEDLGENVAFEPKQSEEGQGS